jgi:ATP-dependent exoDNAse (exonuclease V) alpha subunit
LSELDRFIDTFSKAIRGEMESMRKQLGSFEIPLGTGQQSDTNSSKKHAYHFSLPAANDKLHPGLECTLRCEKSEFHLQIIQVEANSIDIECDESLPLDDRKHILVIYPWFLYEKLLASLESLRDPMDFHIDSAMRLFGKRAPQIDPSQRPQLDHPGLNPSQMRAIELCCRSNLAFVWGPPGTGKTSTLAPLLAEMLHRGYRTLVTSTTNVAVDQALEKLLQLPVAQSALADQRIIRIGQIGGTTIDVSLQAMAAQRSKDLIAQLQIRQNKRLDRQEQLASCQKLLDKLKDDIDDGQLNLFAAETPRRNFTQDLRAIYPLHAGRHLRSVPTDRLKKLLERRQSQLERFVALCESRVEHMRQQLRQGERRTLERAQLVFSTMSGAYLNNHLKNERFDVVVIEEAGMAALPTLFYCAALASQKIIAVGDPRQLPPIVQSRAPFVYRAMGRNIFDVSVPAPLNNDFVALLDTQYRMHPAIGRLVSDLYYDGQLRHDESTQLTIDIVDRAPYPGSPLILLDTMGQTQCQKTKSYSRVNESSARLAAELALHAANSGIQSIGVITPYNEQAKLIGKIMRELGLKKELAESSTVHRFQGQERDLVILDTTDAAPLRPGVLLNDPVTAVNLLNVSLSRARGKLIVIADIAYFDHGAPSGQIARLLKEIRRVGVCTTADAPMA